MILRSGVYYYWRRVPKKLANLDDRAPIVRHSLKTDDLVQSRSRRDILEHADNDLWGSMLLEGKGTEQAVAAYKSAKLRAEVLGFIYRPAEEIAQAPIEDIMQRLAAIMDSRTPISVETAILGGADIPKVLVSKAFDLYCDEIVATEVAGKSQAQLKMWRKVKKRAIDSFIAVVGDKPMVDITREDGRTFYQHWLAHVVPKNGGKRKSASLGNRMVGNMRVLYKAYFDYAGVHDRINPFASLSFSEKFKRSRPPFLIEWIKTRVLHPGALAGMNGEGRGVVLTLIETGARPSEICNLSEETIRLNDAVPHILIEPRIDPDDPREIKTATSVRAVPLVGLALETMKCFPKGFPRYKDRESAMSTALNKFFRTNKLFPTPEHKIYSFRHTFEDRMKEAGIDDELRRILMGHAIDRPKYGSGGSLEWRRDEMLKIVLPFDASIV